METLKEVSVEEISQKFHWEMPHKFNFKSIDEVVDASIQLDPVECKGFVIVDKV